MAVIGGRISIRSVNNTKNDGKFWKCFRGCFVFQSRVSTKTVVRKSFLQNNSAEQFCYHVRGLCTLTSRMSFAFHMPPAIGHEQLAPKR